MTDDRELQKRKPFRLTREMVLLAAERARAPYSTYIHDHVLRMHDAHISAGGTGYPPRSSLVLARLSSLARAGLLDRSWFATGNYGYRWDITDASRKVLAAMDPADGFSGPTGAQPGY